MGRGPRRLWLGLSLVTSLVGASAASAVSLTLSADQTYYDISDTITITVTGDLTGAPAGSAVFVQLYYDASVVTPLGRATQTPIVSTFGFVSWTASNPACGASVCTVFNQIVLDPLVPESPVIIGTLRLHKAGVGFGVLSIGVVEETLDFFGAPAPPPIPEPGTAALLGLGLTGPASLRRRLR